MTDYTISTYFLGTLPLYYTGAVSLGFDDLTDVTFHDTLDAYGRAHPDGVINDNLYGTAPRLPTPQESATYDLGSGAVTSTLEETYYYSGTVTYLDGTTEYFDGQTPQTSLTVAHLSDGALFLTIRDDQGATWLNDKRIAEIDLQNVTRDAFDTFGATARDNMSFVCFAGDTLIETNAGPRPARELRAHDLVKTLDNGYQPIRWIGKRRVSGRLAETTPVLIKAGTLGNDRDLRVSPQHRMLITSAQAQYLFGNNEVLVRAKDLVDGTCVRFAPCDSIDYVHFLLGEHEIVFAEGALSESFLPGPQGIGSLNRSMQDEIFKVFPGLRKRANAVESARPLLRSFEAQLLHITMQAA